MDWRIKLICKSLLLCAILEFGFLGIGFIVALGITALEQLFGAHILLGLTIALVTVVVFIGSYSFVKDRNPLI